MPRVARLSIEAWRPETRAEGNPEGEPRPEPTHAADARERPTLRPPVLAARQDAAREAAARTRGDDGRLNPDSGIRMRTAPRRETPADAPSIELPAGGRQSLELALVTALGASDADAALLLASSLLYMDPGNDAARRIKLGCIDRLRGRKTRELPRPHAVPRRLLAWDELRGRELSRYEAYVLSLVDGESTVEAIIDASALPPLVAYEALDHLLRSDIVGL